MIIASPEFSPHTPGPITEVEVPLQQISYSKKHLVAPFARSARMNYTFCLHIVRLENRRTDHYDVKNS